MFYPYTACIQIHTSQENNLFTPAAKTSNWRQKVRACEHDAPQHEEVPDLTLTRFSVEFTFILKPFLIQSHRILVRMSKVKYLFYEHLLRQLNTSSFKILKVSRANINEFKSNYFQLGYF